MSRTSKRPQRRTNKSTLGGVVLGLGMGALSACGGDEPSPKKLEEPVRMSREDLMDPKTCESCHPRHYREWASSMHAYASKDPVFLAMNQRGQRETDHGMGDFCVNCHAPMAVREGLTTDGLNLATLPEQYQGVTCYFCHNAVSIEADHNAQLSLANDQTMRGGLHDAYDPGVHAVAYSDLHDRNNLKSSQFCGSCHDVVTPKGVHIERTYAEYLQTGFSKPENDGFDSCVGCHMDESGSGAPVAVMPGVKLRERPMHEHLWPAVDIALSDDFPDQAAYRKAVECALANGPLVELTPMDAPLYRTFKVSFETLAGHAQPSGAAQDRRLWLELIAYDADDNVLFQTGVIADQAVEDLPKEDPAYDSRLWMFRDHIYDAMGKEVHMFWDAEASSAFPLGYGGPAQVGVETTQPNVLPIAVMVPGRHYAFRTFTMDVASIPQRVTARLLMRPVGMDILNDLVATGDLDPEVLKRMPTFPLPGTHVEWTIADGPDTVDSPVDSPIRCPDDYLKLYE